MHICLFHVLIMVFSKEDKILIKDLWESKGYSARENLLRRFRIRTGTEKDWIICWRNCVRQVLWNGRLVAAGAVQHARCRTLMPLKTSSRQTQNASVNMADCTRNWCVTESHTNCHQRPVAEMFQTTQSPGTDGIQQVGMFSPIATTFETLPRARCCIYVVYW